MIFYPKLYLRYKFEIVEVGDEATAVTVGDDADDFNGVVVLKNESTRYLFELLTKGATLPELIKLSMDKYPESSVEEVGPNVLKFLDMLKEKGLIMADKTQGMQVDERAFGKKDEK